MVKKKEKNLGLESSCEFGAVMLTELTENARMMHTEVEMIGNGPERRVCQETDLMDKV